MTTKDRDCPHFQNVIYGILSETCYEISRIKVRIPVRSFKLAKSTVTFRLSFL